MSCAAFVNAMASVYSWSRRKVAGALQLSLLLALVAGWAMVNALEISALSFAEKVFWGKVSYIGVVNIAPLWLLFSLNYSQKKDWITPLRIVGLWIYPVITIVLVFTNEMHKLIWPNIRSIDPTSGAVLIYDHGIGVYLYAAYSYVLLFVGSYWLIRSGLNSARLYRFQIGSIIIAVATPWIANVMYFLDINPWPGVDLTILGFSVTGIVAAYSLYGFKVLDLAPVAREVLFNNIRSGVVVIDNSNRIVDLNPTVKSWTGLDDSAIGSNFFDAIRADEQIRKFEHIVEGQALLKYGYEKSRQIINLEISPLKDSQGKIIGRVASLNDVSKEHALMDDAQKRANQIGRLNSITHQAMLAESLDLMLQPLVDRLAELFGADEAFIALWDEHHRTTQPAAAFGPQRDTYPRIRLQPGEKTLTESVITYGKVLVVDDSRTTNYQSSQVAALFPRRSMLVMPLMGLTQNMGSALISFNNPHTFTQDEIVLGEQAAGQISLAMERVRLLESEKGYIAQLTALQSLSQSVLASLDLKQIFKTVVRTLNQVFHYRYVSIYEFDGKKLILGAQINYPLELVLSEIPVDRGVMGRSVRTKKPQFVRNVRSDPDFLLATYEVESEICVPLLKEQTVLGTLNIESYPPQVLTDTDMLLMGTFAGQVAIAIEHAKLFEKMEQKAEVARLLQSAICNFSDKSNYDAVLTSVAGIINNALGAEGCVIFRWDSKKDILLKILETASTDTIVSDIPNFISVNEHTLFLNVLAAQKAIRINLGDDLSLSPFEYQFLSGMRIGSMLIYPLLRERDKQPFGLVLAYRSNLSSIFTDDELGLGTGLLVISTLAIENANLYKLLGELPSNNDAIDQNSIS